MNESTTPPLDGPLANDHELDEVLFGPAEEDTSGAE